MKNYRPRTRGQHDRVLMRQYRLRKEKENSQSSKFSISGDSSKKNNMSLDFNDYVNDRGVKRNSDDFTGLYTVDTSSEEDSVRSGLDGSQSKKNQKNGTRVNWNKKDDFVQIGLEKKQKSSGSTRKNQNIQSGEDASDDELNVIQLTDEDESSEDESFDDFETRADSKKLGDKNKTKRREKMPFKKRVIEKRSEINDEKREYRVPYSSSSRKNVIDTTKRKGFNNSNKRVKCMDKLSVDSDDEDYVKILGESDGSTMNSVFSGFGKGPSAKDEKTVFSTERSDESSESTEDPTSSESEKSSDSLYREERESSSSDEIVSSDHGSSSVGEDEGVDEHQNKPRSKKVAVKSVPKKGKSLMPRHRCTFTRENKVEKTNNLMGTSSCPFTLSDDEEHNLSEEEDVSSGDERANPQVRDHLPDVCEDIERDKGKNQSEEEDVSSGDEKVNPQVRDHVKDVCEDIGRDKGKKKFEISAKNVPVAQVNKMLVDKIWERAGTSQENLVPPTENPPDEAGLLPLKFKGFSDSDSDMEIPEKSECELEAERLFQEMDYAMEYLNTGKSDADMMDSEEKIASRKGPAYCIDGGSHSLVLDEQIGLRCTVCHFVTQDIRDIMPNFAKNQGGRAEARGFDRADYSSIDIHNKYFTSTNLPTFEQNNMEGTVWDLIPGTKNGMYPHQQEGFEFIWKNIAGSIFIDDAKKCISDGGGNGCIISHAPGTGKTRLTIMFLQSYMELNPDCRPLIIAPCSMLITWEQELRKWNSGISFVNLSSQAHKLENGRLLKLLSWKKQKTVLGISYQLFEELAYFNEKNKKTNDKDDVEEEIRKMLLLLPGLLVLDEGHIPRSHKSSIWKAFLEVRTERRILLSGTPFQNSFEELLNTFCVARPNFTNEIMPHNRCKEEKRRITNAVREKWDSMTSNIRKEKEKLKELKDIMDSFVHVYKGTILQKKLPGLVDSVVVLSPTHLQKDLLKVAQTIKNAFKREHVLTSVSIHPSLLCSDKSDQEKLPVHRDELERIRLNPNEGVKTRFVLELVRLSEPLKERVLVFGQTIDSLKLIMKHLRTHFHWTQGKEILFMSGADGEKQRQTLIKQLNDPENEVRVLLASVKACSEGINLVGASRVVMLDVNWNPSTTRQAISRAYRLGQKKIVYVYHLIDETWEGSKYLKLLEKVHISELVFSSKDAENKHENSCSVVDDKILEDMVQHPSMRSIFRKILYQPKEQDLIDMFGSCQN